LVLVSVWLIALGGCGGDGQRSPSPAFVYTANGGSDDVSALKEDLNTGALSAVSSSPFPAGSINENVPGAITVDPSGKFLYIGDADSGQISAFSINRDTGALTEVAGSPFSSGASAFVRIHPSGKFLYAANFDQGRIAVFDINSSTGVLSEIAGSPFVLHGLVMSLALHPSGNFAYATFAGIDGLLGIAVFSVDAQTGAITRLSHARLDLQAGNLTMHPSGKFLYSARNSLFLMFSSSGGTAGIWTLAVDPATGILSLPTDRAAATANPTEVAVDPSGKFAYVTDDIQGTVGQFTIDSNTGVLTHVSDTAAGNQPFSVALGGAGKFLYVGNAGSNNISAFAITGNSGALTAIPGSPYSTGTTPRAVIAVSPR